MQAGQLARARELAGLTQQQIADAVGRPRHTVVDVERGTVLPEPSVLVAWVRACDSSRLAAATAFVADTCPAIIVSAIEASPDAATSLYLRIWDALAKMAEVRT